MQATATAAIQSPEIYKTLIRIRHIPTPSQEGVHRLEEQLLKTRTRIILEEPLEVSHLVWGSSTHLLIFVGKVRLEGFETGPLHKGLYPLIHIEGHKLKEIVHGIGFSMLVASRGSLPGTIALLHHPLLRDKVERLAAAERGKNGHILEALIEMFYLSEMVRAPPPVSADYRRVTTLLVPVEGRYRLAALTVGYPGVAPLRITLYRDGAHTSMDLQPSDQEVAPFLAQLEPLAGPALKWAEDYLTRFSKSTVGVLAYAGRV